MHASMRSKFKEGSINFADLHVERKEVYDSRGVINSGKEDKKGKAKEGSTVEIIVIEELRKEGS